MTTHSDVTIVPFVARLEEKRTHRDAIGREHQVNLVWKIYRDRAGRTRTELRLPTDGEPIDVAMIVDPRRAAAVLVDAVSGESIPEERLKSVTGPVALMPTTSGVNAPPPPAAGTPRLQDLGTSMVGSLKCHGQRAVYEDGTIEHWHAVDVELGRSVVTRMSTSTDDYEASMSDVRLVDPDPLVFEPLDAS